MADTLDTDLALMWKRIYAQCRAIAQEEVTRLFGANLRGGTLDGSVIGGSGSLAEGVIAPSPTNGQVLTTVAGATSWATPASSSVLSTADVANPPTESDLQTALGTPSAVGRQISQIDDAGGGRDDYLTLSDGTSFWSVLLAKARLAASTASATNAASYQTTPTYDGSGQAVEPCVLFFPDGWNGYTYWMAYTPYPSSNAAYENPSILVSNDGTTWSVPTGLTNPIVPAPGSGNNGDPWIVMDTTNTTMWYYFVTVSGGTTAFKVMSSTNGTSWSSPTTLFSEAGGEEPCVLYDGAQYVMYYENTTSFPGALLRRTCATPNGTWSAATTCTLTNVPTGRGITDSSFFKRGSLWHGFVVFWTGSTGTGAYELYFAESSDGLSWTVAAAPLLAPSASGWDDSYTYRAGFVPTATGYDLWYSAMSTSDVWHIGRTTVTLNNLTVAQLGRVIQIRDTTANILAFGGTLEEAALAYATDTGRVGLYSGVRWNWSASVADLGSIVTTLAGLADVGLTSLADGQSLRWDAATSRWVNYTPQVYLPVVDSAKNLIYDSSGALVGAPR